MEMLENLVAEAGNGLFDPVLRSLSRLNQAYYLHGGRPEQASILDGRCALHDEVVEALDDLMVAYDEWLG